MTALRAKQVAAVCELIDDSTIRMFELQATQLWFRRQREVARSTNAKLGEKRAATSRLILLAGAIAMLDAEWLMLRFNRRLFMNTYESLSKSRR
jgi:hypothetical protein